MATKKFLGPVEGTDTVTWSCVITEVRPYVRILHLHNNLLGYYLPLHKRKLRFREATHPVIGKDKPEISNCLMSQTFCVFELHNWAEFCWSSLHMAYYYRNASWRHPATSCYPCFSVQQIMCDKSDYNEPTQGNRSKQVPKG